MKRFWFWFAMEFLSYALIVANGRAYVQGHYFWTVLTDLSISAQGFILSKKFIADKDSLDWIAMAGYVLGGASGSVFSIFITKVVYGE